MKKNNKTRAREKRNRFIKDIVLFMGVTVSIFILIILFTFTLLFGGLKSNKNNFVKEIVSGFIDDVQDVQASIEISITE